MAEWQNEPIETGHYWVSMYWPPAARIAFYFHYDKSVAVMGGNVESLKFFKHEHPEAQFKRIAPEENIYAKNAAEIKAFCREYGVMEPKQLSVELKDKLAVQLGFRQSEMTEVTIMAHEMNVSETDLQAMEDKIYNEPVKYTRFPMTCKEYRTVYATVPIENIPGIYNTVRDWVTEDARVNQFLHKDNREDFERLFGKPEFYFTSEFRFHCYSLDLGDAKLLLLTAKGKGTCYELIIATNQRKFRKNSDRVIQFLDGLVKDLEKLNG